MNHDYRVMQLNYVVDLNYSIRLLDKLKYILKNYNIHQAAISHIKFYIEKKQVVIVYINTVVMKVKGINLVNKKGITFLCEERGIIYNESIEDFIDYYRFKINKAKRIRMNHD